VLDNKVTRPPAPYAHTMDAACPHEHIYYRTYATPFCGGGGVNRREGEAEQERAGHAGTEEYISNMYIPGTKQQ